MDPITQGIVGTAVVQQVSRLTANKRQLLTVSGLAFASAMAPDADILIRSSEDPMVFLEYHRQFTHSFAFIPVGGLVCALLGFAIAGKRVGLSFAATYAICTLAYATHGLLDACTSYGTLLLWPFSNARIAWHNMPIVDPFYTVPLIVLCIARLKSGKRRWSRLALFWLFSLPLLGVMQRENAEVAATELAASRGHAFERLEVRPGFGNLFVWRSVYQTTVNGEARYFVDAIHSSSKQKVYEGSSIAVLKADRDFPWLDKTSQQAKDIERFRWFSNDYLSVDPSNQNRIVDMRYSMMPHQIKPFWGIVLDLDRSANQHVEYTVTRTVEPKAFSILGDMILGRELAE